MSNNEGKNNNQPDGQEVKLTSIFNEAIKIESSSERDAFIKAACGDDTALLTRVEALLKVYFEDKGHHKSPQGGLNSTFSTTPLTEGPGAKIGRYKLLQLIGEGGCGVVYMAEQERPIRRRVAFKIIKLGMDTKLVIARFEAERQALALMDHPNIAKVLDAGATETGRPYFVMELVRGIKITDYCDQNNLSTEQRLELFVQICHAVQHAHQKGIIHRDIKPSNILVTLHDGVPVPKIIDFGIAKATTGQMLTDKTLFTAYEQFVGTPAYMSPEQAEMSGLDVDTRSDIYALGVLLYELLTGQTPFSAKELAEAGLNEMRKIIREKEPPKPSTKISSLNAEDQTTVAKRRHSETPQLIHIIRGDLDWIVMKCLEKDRTRRYETANGLAHDILCHLNSEPVLARPPSRLYRFQKLVHRNKLLFASAALVVAALVIGLGLSTFMFFKERDARQMAIAAQNKALAEASKSEQVAQSLKDMLQGLGPSVAQGRDTTMLREILDKTAERVGKDLKDQPEVEAELRSTIGEVYSELGQFGKAEQMHRAALTLRRSLWGNMNTSVADSLDNLGDVLILEDKIAEADSAIQEALTIRTNLLGSEHVKVAASLYHMGKVRDWQARTLEAEALYRQSLAMRRKLLGNEHLDVAESLGGLSGALEDLGRLEEAETAAREALAIRARVLPEEERTGMDVSEAQNTLGWALLDQGKLDEAETVARQQLMVDKKLLGAEHPKIVRDLCLLAFALAREEKHLDEAEAAAREGLAIGRKTLGEQHPRTVFCLWALGETLHKAGRLAEAETTYREGLAIWHKLRELNDKLGAYNSLDMCSDLGGVLEEEGKLSEAESLYREELEAARKSPDSNVLVTSLSYLAGFLRLREGKPAEAESLYREGLAISEKSSPGNFRQRAWLAHGLGSTLRYEGKMAEAESLYRETLEAVKKSQPAFSLVYLYGGFGDLLRDEYKWSEAETIYRGGLDVYSKLTTNNFGARAWLVYGLGDTLRQQGRSAEAESLYRKTLEGRKNSPPSDSVVTVLAGLGDMLRGEGKLSEAEPLYREGLDICKKVSPHPHELHQWCAAGIGMILRQQGKQAEAETFYREAIENAAKVWPNNVAKWRWQVDNLVDVLHKQGKDANAAQIISEALAKK